MPTQRQEISASIQSNFPDNTSQFITPARLRTEQGLFEQYAVLNEQTASIIAQAVTSASVGAGSVTTASFNAYTASTNTFTQSIQTQVNALQAATSSYVPNAATSSMSIVTLNVSQSFTASGLIYPTADGLVDQVLQTNGAGVLSFNNVDTILEAVYAGENITKGDPLYISGSQGANPIVYRADAADANKMPVTYIAYETLSAGATGRAIILGLIEGMNLTGYNAGDEVYVAAGGGWTSTRPTGSAIIQFLGIVTKGGAGGKGLVLNPGPATLPNLTSGYVWVGDANGQPVAVSTSSIATTVNTGSLLVTASAVLNTITFTKGDASTFAVTVDTGSGGGGGMNLGANTFTGSQTLSSSTIPASLIFRVSGSLAAFVTESNGFGSTNTGYGNIIFQNRTNAAFSGSEIISGSSNIIFANGTATTSLKGISGFGNIGLLPIYSGSIPSGQSNYFGGTLTSSGSRQAITQNNIIGSATLVESNNISASFTNNYVNAVQAVFNSNYSGSTGTFASTISNNTINGASHLIQIAGSGSQNRQFANNLIGGNANTASLTTATGSSNNSGSLMNTLIYGTNLIVSGTQINTATLHGGAFVGRYNETGSLADHTVVFAVGAGTSNTLRKTSLYVSASGDVVINATSGGLASSFNSRFAPNYVTILNNTINSNTTVGGPGNGSFVTNGGSITGGGNNLNNVIIAAELGNITAGRQSAIIAGESNTINTVVPSNSQRPNIIAASIQSQINGATTGSMNAIIASSGSFISQSNNSAILANGIVNTTIINASSSVALGRDTAYTANQSYTLYTQNINASGSVNISGSIILNGTTLGAAFPYTGSATISGSLAVNGTVDNTLATTVVGTGSITNRIHTKQSGAIASGSISSSAFISPEIGLEATTGNFKLILERNITGSVGPSGSYAFSLDYINTVLVSGGTDSYVGIGKISGFCLPGRRPTTPFATASIQVFIQNDAGMSPTLSSSFDGTLYQVYAKHQGGASSSFAYTGTEWYHLGQTQ